MFSNLKNKYLENEKKDFIFIKLNYFFIDVFEVVK